MDIKRVVEENDNPGGRAFDLIIQGLIVFSLASFCIETLPDLPASMIRTLQVLEVATIVIFSLEYVLRIAVADRKLAYVFSFYGLVDVVAILPFYLRVGLDLRPVRSFRLFRLFRMLKLVRYTRALARFREAWRESREEFFLYFTLTGILMFLSSVGIYYCEHEAQPAVFTSVFDAMWWAVESFTTVGYGDLHPITVGGKIFTFFVLILGLGVVAVPPAILASALTRVKQQEEELSEGEARESGSAKAPGFRKRAEPDQGQQDR